MGFMEFFRGNDGGKHQAVPGPENYTTDEEARVMEANRLRKEGLENLIVEIEGNPAHERRGELQDLREQLRQIQSN